MSINPIFIESKELSLPMTITFDVNFKDKKDSIHLWFSQSRKNWGQVGCDGLVASFSSSRADFTYRSDGYKVSNPSLTVQRHETFLAEPNKTYRFKSVITDSFALYYIDEKLYASANFPPGTVPSKGYFGFATDHDNFRSFASKEKFMSAKARLIYDHALFGRMLLASGDDPKSEPLLDKLCDFVNLSRAINDAAATNAKNVYDEAIKKAREAEQDMINVGNASDGTGVASGVLGIFAAIAMCIPGGQGGVGLALTGLSAATGFASFGTGISEVVDSEEFENKMKDINNIAENKLASNEVLLAAKSMECLERIANEYEKLDVFYGLEVCINIFCANYVHQLEQLLGHGSDTKLAVRAFYEGLSNATLEHEDAHTALEIMSQSEALSLPSVANKLQKHADKVDAVDAATEEIIKELFIQEVVLQSMQGFASSLKSYAKVSVLYCKLTLKNLAIPMNFTKLEKWIGKAAQSLLGKLGAKGAEAARTAATVAETVELIPVARALPREAFSVAASSTEQATSAISNGIKAMKVGKAMLGVTIVFDFVTVGWSIYSLVERVKSDDDFKAQLTKIHDNFHDIIDAMKSFNEDHIPDSSLLGPGYLHHSGQITLVQLNGIVNNEIELAFATNKPLPLDNLQPQLVRRWQKSEGEYIYDSILHWSTANGCFTLAYDDDDDDVEIGPGESVESRLPKPNKVVEDLFMVVNRDGLLSIMRCADHNYVTHVEKPVQNSFIAGDFGQAKGKPLEIKNIQDGNFSLSLKNGWGEYKYLSLGMDEDLLKETIYTARSVGPLTLVKKLDENSCWKFSPYREEVRYIVTGN